MSLREAVLRRVAPFCFWLPGAFRVQTARLDLAAGAASAALTLPQSIVFANLAGVPPQYGLYTA
ncbi:MAG: SulP family inorganic anion transporter, partial [Gammaproteobacteria bacterium]|nr:SulP family inorganic anion transporter [Gammaproteobacteria bacterium]